MQKDIKASFDKDAIYLIEWKNQYYYVEGKKEMRKVLRPFSKFPRLLTSIGYLWASFNHEAFPASSKEEMTGWRRGEFERELHELYGQGFEHGNSITINALPINFDEESQTAELTCHGPIQVYERIEKYPKSEFKESSYEWTLKYFEKL